MFSFKRRNKFRVDYQRPTIKTNPYFPKNTRRGIGFKKIAVITAIAAIFILLGYFLFFSSFFTINKIAVTGNKNILAPTITDTVQQTLNKKKYFILPRTNIFILDIQDVVKVLNGQFLLDNIKVEKKYPFELSIAIKEKISRFVLGIEYSEDVKTTTTSTSVILRKYVKSYLVDRDGLITGNFIDSADAAADYPRVVDTNSRAINIGDYVLDKQKIEQILYLYDKINQKTELAVKELQIDSSIPEQTVVVADKRGFTVKFELNDKIDRQIQSLTLLWSSKLKNAINNLEYIDLRFGEKIYYKTK